MELTIKIGQVEIMADNPSYNRPYELVIELDAEKIVAAIGPYLADAIRRGRDL